MKMKEIFFIFIVTLSFFYMQYPASSYEWSTYIGGSGWDYCYAVLPLPKGGVVVFGDTESYGAGNTDLLILRLSDNGTILWQKTFGGTGFDQEPLGAFLTAENTLVLTAKTDSFGHGGYDLWLLTIDLSGNLLMEATYGGPTFDAGYSVDKGLGGGLIVSGATSSYGTGSFDAWVLKLDDLGNPEWQNTYGTALNDFAFAISTGSDGYWLAGATEKEEGQYDVLAMKLDVDGNVVWNKSLGGAKNDYAYSVKALQDGCIIAGATDSFGAGGIDAWVIRLDGDGNVVWQKTYGGAGFDEIRGVIATQDGFLFSGVTDSFGSGTRKAWAFQTDQAGNVTWENTYGGSLDDMANAIAQLGEEKFVIAGGTSSFGQGGFDAWIFSIDSSGTPSEPDIVMAPGELTSLSPVFTGEMLNLVPNETTSAPVPYSLNVTNLDEGNVTGNEQVEANVTNPPSPTLAEESHAENETVADEGSQQPETATLTVGTKELLCQGLMSPGTVVISHGNETICEARIEVGGCSYEFPLGTNVTLTARPVPGYAFAGWEYDGGMCTEDNQCRIQLDGNRTLTARFRLEVDAPKEPFYLDLQVSRNATCLSPMGVGPAATGQPYLDWDIMLPGFSSPVDVYLGVLAPSIVPETIFLVTDSGIEPFNGTLKPWKRGISRGLHERPFGVQQSTEATAVKGIPVPPGTYHLYLLILPQGSDLSDGYYLLHTLVNVNR